MWPYLASGLAAALGCGLAAAECWRKNLNRWLPAYLKWRPEPFDDRQPLHLYFCFADHYEPLWGHVDEATGIERVARWQHDYPKVVDEFRDSEDRPAQHTFFFPAEEYRPIFMDRLKELCSRGYGDVEIHIHHDKDTRENFIETMERFIAQLQLHGFLLNRQARHRLGFIHGNWCLDNSRKDGRWCGLNDEIDLLCKLGCYADFTFPSAPSETQPGMINCIYYCRDDVERPASHRHGRLAKVGIAPQNDELCLITGPLGFNYSSRKFGLLPRIENGDINGGIVANQKRCQLWLNLGARVLGAPNHIFVKVHTHGTQERLQHAVLGEQARGMYRALSGMRNQGVNLHFVTAYEMWQTVRALETGRSRKAPRASDLQKVAL